MIPPRADRLGSKKAFLPLDFVAAPPSPSSDSTLVLRAVRRIFELSPDDAYLCGNHKSLSFHPSLAYRPGFFLRLGGDVLPGSETRLFPYINGEDSDSSPFLFSVVRDHKPGYFFHASRRLLSSFVVIRPPFSITVLF